jgi:hypothetical protein
MATVFASVMVSAISKKHNEDRKIVAFGATLACNKRITQILKFQND